MPADSRHDLWTGVDEVPRLLQATQDGNFEVEVKFDSPVVTRYQMQGLLVQQDARNLLRLEVHHEGNGVFLFVAAITDGVATVIDQKPVTGGAPAYLRLKRNGNTWTLRYSNDGQSWVTSTFTRALTVSGVGPYAGNSGSALPAFTSRIDYFRFFAPDQAPPVISAISSAPTAIGAEVTWTTNEPATSSVAYGLTTAYQGGVATTAGEHLNHRVVLHGLECGTTYHFQVRSDGRGGERRRLARSDPHHALLPGRAHLGRVQCRLAQHRPLELLQPARRRDRDRRRRRTPSSRSRRG